MFITSRLVQLNYEKVMTLKVHVPIWVVESRKRKGNRYTENLMSHNFFIISLLRPWSYEKVMTADVLVPVMRYNAVHNNMMSHNLFITSRLVQQNYEKVMTLKVHVPIWWWRVGNERERETRKTA